MANCVLIDVVNTQDNSSWHKVKKDVTQICNEIGFDSVVWHNQKHWKIFRILDALCGIKKMNKTLSDGDWVILQYPHHPWVIKHTIHSFNKLKDHKNCKLIILLHDVCFLRGLGYPLTGNIDMKHFEVDVCNQADAVIAHNDAMRNALVASGVKTSIYTLGIFDYLSLTSRRVGRKKSGDKIIVTYAGALSREKCGYLYGEINLKNTQIYLYGNEFNGVSSHNILYKGSLNPEELVEEIEGDYGLIWDGTSMDTCNGNYGEYLKYNSPFKCSLYIAAGMPVIVWKESAIASYVLERGIGVAIKSLRELDSIPKPNSREYEAMITNVNLLGKKIRKGIMLKTVISDINVER